MKLLYEEYVHYSWLKKVRAHQPLVQVMPASPLHIAPGDGASQLMRCSIGVPYPQCAVGGSGRWLAGHGTRVCAVQVWDKPLTDKPELEPCCAAAFHGIELAFLLLAEFITDKRT